MTSNNFRIDPPFETKPPALRDIVNKHVMGYVWQRDKPFDVVTDSLIIAEKFGMLHKNILRAIEKCRIELSTQLKFELNQNLIDNSYLAGPEGRKRKERKVDITEFGFALLLLYINSPKARLISAEIIYRFFVLKSYIKGLKPNQLDALKGYYRKQIKKEG